MKRCTKCGTTKPLEAFPKRKDAPDGFRNHCKECCRKYMQQYEPRWRAENPDKTRAKWQRYYEKQGVIWDRERCNRYDAANREKRRLAMAKRRAEDPEYQRTLRKRWRDANIDARRAASRAYWHWRRSGSIRNPAVDVYAEWLLLQNCFYCGASSGPMTIDHVMPLSRGGVHEADNLVPACQSCNSSKGAKLLEEWQRP